jgi:hypothetical protein
MKNHLIKFGVTLTIFGVMSVSERAEAREVRSVKEIKTLFHAKASGNDFFNRRLRERIKTTGVKFVNSRQKADGILESKGNWNGNGFVGEMTIKSRQGKVVWREQSRRSGSSNKMAFEQLGDKFRAARR